MRLKTRSRVLRKEQHFPRKNNILTKHSVEKYYKTRSRFFQKNQHLFREINVFTKEVTKALISQFFFFFCSVIACFSNFPHCAIF